MGKDLRDPAALYLAVIAHRSGRGDQRTLSQAYDSWAQSVTPVPLYSDEGENHPLRYRKELEERAANGDKYATALLSGETLAEEVVD